MRWRTTGVTGQLGLTADERRWGGGSAGGLGAGGRAGASGVSVTVTSATNRSPWPCTVRITLLRLPAVAHRAARRLDAGGEGFLPDALVGPHLRQEFVPGDDAVALLDEIGQHLKDFRPQRDARPLSAEFIALRIQRIIAKHIGHRPWSCVTPETLRVTTPCV